MPAPDYRPLSLWFDSLDEEVVARPSLDSSLDVDVAIVGAGFSGLWTAYYLRALRPDWSIAIVEAEVAGFGASGRNGGWALGHLSGIEALLERESTRSSALDLLRAMFDTVDDIGRVCAQEKIDCHFAKSGSIHFATNVAQRARLHAHFEEMSRWGLGDAVHWLSPEEVARRVRPSHCLGGLYEPDVAVLHPARLARGLARAVEARGVRLFERTPAQRIEAGKVETAGGALRAELVVRATEAYTARLPGHERALLPLHSWMIATEPLPEATWAEIGLDAREAFGDGRRLVTYGQRTSDGRLAFGARGTYEFGSGIRERFDPRHENFLWMETLLRQIFPVLEQTRFTHHWGGAMGVPRNWRPSIGVDRKQRFAWLGGYVGQGVAAAHLAGQTLAELIAEEDTSRTRLPWVSVPSRNWEPEPLRWLAVAAIAGSGRRADAAEDAGQSAGLSGRIFDLATR